MTIAECDEKIRQKREELKSVKGCSCEVYTRIVGYYRPVKNWNSGKRAEYNQRKPFKGFDREGGR